MCNRWFRWPVAAALTLAAAAAPAATLPLPADADLVGEYAEIAATREDTLIDIARRYSLGYEEVVNANLGVDQSILPTLTG
jgi:L,D-transpeptidase ErfK/SrfK